MMALLKDMSSAQKEMFKRSPWAGRKDDEAKAVKEISRIPALYKVLGDRFDTERAGFIVSQILVPIYFW